MRVSTGQLQMTLLLGMQNGQNQYNTLMAQMASGNRILKPSDDALGSVRLLGLTRQQSSLDQYQKNIAQVQSSLSEEETQLSSVNQVLMRVRDLTLEAGNGAIGVDERKAINNELTVLLDSLVDFANTKGEQGNYLFSGSQVDKPAVVKDGAGNYVYQGDTLVREVNVAKGVTVKVNDTAQGLFFSGGGGGFFNQLKTFIDVLDTATGDVNGDMQTALDAIDGVLGSVTRTLTEIGGRQNMLDQLESAHGDMLLYSKKLSTDISALDYGKASIQANQVLLQLQSTQQAYLKLNNLSLFSQS